MAEDRPPIPRPMKRAIRQRCGFGCVLCGQPLYEYDHLDGWAEVHEHVADRITLLCDKHHKEKTNRLLPHDAVERANADPINRRNGQSAPYALHFSGTSLTAMLGNNEVSHDQMMEGCFYAALTIDRRPVISFGIEDSRVLLSIDVRDAEGAPLMTVDENELVYTSSTWDVEFVGPTLTLRDGPGQIALEIEFVPPSTIQIRRAKLPSRHGLIVVDDTALRIPPGRIFRGFSVRNCGSGIEV